MVLLLMREKKMYRSEERPESNNKLVETGFTLSALKIGANLVRPAIVELVKKLLRVFPTTRVPEAGSGFEQANLHRVTLHLTPSRVFARIL
jgi:hypothetical protein